MMQVLVVDITIFPKYFQVLLQMVYCIHGSWYDVWRIYLLVRLVALIVFIVQK